MKLKTRRIFQNILSILGLFVFLAFNSCSSNSDKTRTAKDEINNVKKVQVNENAYAQTEEMDQDSSASWIIYFGDSLTAGLGLASKDDAYPNLIQDKISELGLPYKSINAGLSGETSAGGRERVSWYLQQHHPSVFILALGANDGLRGIDPSSTYENLKNIIAQVRSKNPECTILLAGMKVPPNMGNKYSEEFEAVFKNLAKNENVVLIPFLLEGVAGIPALNQTDGIHPTAEGQKIMAKVVWDKLEPHLK
jgi:acyl-CoA thioesterase-1